jgi:lipopolysaccharide transport system permease protein
MFLSCVVFPANMFKGVTYKIMMCNPVASSLEAIKFILTGHGIFSMHYILGGIILTIILFLFSLIVFNKTEKSFMDTV